MCLRKRSLHWGVEIGRSCTWGSAWVQSCSLLLFLTVKLLWGRKGVKGKQPQLEFSFLHTAASISVPCSRTAKLSRAGTVTAEGSPGCSAIPKVALWGWISTSAAAAAELGSQLFHLCSCEHWFLFDWPFWAGGEPKLKSHLQALSTLSLLGSGWREPVSQTLWKKCILLWFASVSTLVLAARVIAEGLSYRRT